MCIYHKSRYSSFCHDSLNLFNIMTARERLLFTFYRFVSENLTATAFSHVISTYHLLIHNFCDYMFQIYSHVLFKINYPSPLVCSDISLLSPWDNKLVFPIHSLEKHVKIHSGEIHSILFQTCNLFMYSFAC